MSAIMEEYGLSVLEAVMGIGFISALLTVVFAFSI